MLEVEGLCKEYIRKEHKVEAVKEIQFQVSEGEVLGIVGESGSGKSSLLKLIAGLDIPEKGEIRLDGIPLKRRRTREDCKKIQMVFQDAVASFDPKMRMRSSIKEALRNLGEDARDKNIEAMMQKIGLPTELLERYPQSLSGGQCQRMAIARAIVVHPKVLLCDEVTSALDVSAQAQILQLLKQIRQETKMSMIFVSHDLAVVRCICDRVLVMKDGREVEQGTVKEILQEPKEEYTKLLVSVMFE